MSDEELDDLNTCVKTHLTKPKQSNGTTLIVSKAYLRLRDLNLKEEAFFLYLTYSLSLSPRCLWFLTAESIGKNGILTYWDPALD